MTGLLPTANNKAKSQRSEFARQLAQQTGFPVLESNDWADLFTLLGRFRANRPSRCITR